VREKEREQVTLYNNNIITSQTNVVGWSRGGGRERILCGGGEKAAIRARAERRR